MERLLIALGIAVVAAVIGLVWRRRRGPDAPMRSNRAVPEQLDRADFASPDVAWLAAVFTSATCSSCPDVQAKVEVLRSDNVAVDVIEYQSRRDLHQRYRIDSVPLVVIADDTGVVRQHFLGPLLASDLWAAMARLRGS